MTALSVPPILAASSSSLYKAATRILPDASWCFWSLLTISPCHLTHCNHTGLLTDPEAIRKHMTALDLDLMCLKIHVLLPGCPVVKKGQTP